MLMYDVAQFSNSKKAIDTAWAGAESQSALNDPLHQEHDGDEEIEDQYGFLRRDKDEHEKPARDEKT